MVKIVRYYTTGNPDVLKIEDLPLTKPCAGEVRLKIEAIGINRVEIMFREGKYLETDFPARLGSEAAGIVDAVGEGVNGIHVGDRVSTIPATFSMGKYGVYGESAIVPANSVAIYPEQLSPSEGAAIWMQYLTAFGALIEFGQIQRGDHILITAASSSVGNAAIQMVKASGAVAIATTRGNAKKRLLFDAGADYVVVTDEEDLANRVKEITSGKGVDLIFDPVGGPMLETLADVAAQGATIYVYGALASAPTPFPVLTALGKGLSVRGYSMVEINKDPEKLARAKRYVYEGLKSGTLKPLIDRVFTLDEIVEAHRYMESNQQNGKIIVTV